MRIDENGELGLFNTPYVEPSVFAATPASNIPAGFTSQDILNYFNTPGLTPQEAVRTMQQYNVQPEDIASILGLTPEEARAQYSAALTPTGVAPAVTAPAGAAQNVIDENDVLSFDETNYAGDLGADEQDVFNILQSSQPSTVDAAPAAAPVISNAAPSTNNALDVLDTFQKIASVGQTVQNVGSAASAASAATKLAGAADAGTSLFGFDPASILVSALTRFMFNRKAPSYLDLNPAVPVTPEMNAQSLYDLLQSTEAQPSEFGDTEGRDSLDRKSVV